MPVLGIPAWVMSPQYRADLQSQLGLISRKAAKGVLHRVAFKSGQRMGFAFGGPFPPEMAETERADRLQLLPRFAFEMGHGRSAFTARSVEAGEAMRTLLGSVSAEHHARPREAMCHHYSGFLAGLLTELRRRPVECEEFECRAKGDYRCTFLFRAAKSIPA